MKSETLTKVIKRFFEKEVVGTREDLIDYVREVQEEEAVLDKRGSVIGGVARTTIYDNLKSLGCYSFPVIKGHGRPLSYFFIDEDSARELLLEKDVKLRRFEKIVSFELTSPQGTIRERAIEQGISPDFYRKALNVLKKSGQFRKDKDLISDLVWNEYLRIL